MKEKYVQPISVGVIALAENNFLAASGLGVGNENHERQEPETLEGE